MAFDTKSNNILPTADKLFTVRSHNFIRKYSKVTKATGFNTRSMVSKVGMTADNFHEQEQGGTIRREEIPHDEVRTSKSRIKRVSKAGGRERYLKNIREQKNSKRGKRSRKSNFVAGAYMAHKNGTMLYFGDRIYKVKSFRKAKNGAPKIKLLQLYNIKKGRDVKIQPTRFIQKSSEIALKKVDRYFLVQANKQFKKYFK